LLKIEVPTTFNVPPSEVLPPATVSVPVPVTVVAPFKLTPPVPVEKVPALDWLKLPTVWLISFVKVETPVTANVLLRFVTPVTVSDPPRDEAPLYTLKLPVPVTVVVLFKRTPPEPVEKLPLPVWLKLPKVWETLLLKVVLPFTPSVPATVVLPFKLTLPVPVEKVPVPTWVILPAVVVPVEETAK